jgi:hypothetical protein
LPFALVAASDIAGLKAATLATTLKASGITNMNGVFIFHLLLLNGAEFVSNPKALHLFEILPQV